jgi:hypothetical protein
MDPARSRRKARALNNVRDDISKGAHMATPRLALVACVCAVTLNGCVSVAGMQDWNYARVNKGRAHQAWLEGHSREQRVCLGCDYELGFKSGFVDSALGRDCDLPAIAPPKYWSAKYQSCEGRACVENWFSGYSAGLQAAQHRGFSDMNQVPVSACAPILNRSDCGACYAQPACGCGGGCQACRRGFDNTATTALPFDSNYRDGASSIFQDQAASLEGVYPASVSMVGPVDKEIIATEFNGPFPPRVQP